MSNLSVFTPLMRQSVGFDRFNDLFETLLSDPKEGFQSYPPYNIEKRGADQYRITLAVAGFADKDLTITAEGERLKISGRIEKGPEEENAPAYLHRGIAARSFERSFRLADHIRVEDAALADGLLTIDLVREIPEEKKPRMIPIAGAAKGLLGRGAKTS
jgi:molecular chaperone IbpA